MSELTTDFADDTDVEGRGEREERRAKSEEAKREEVMIEQVKKPLSDKAAKAAGPGAFWRQKMQCPGFLCLLLTVATLWVFSSVAHYDFVNYDDPDYVTANVHVQRGLTWENVAWAFQTGYASNWHPLTWLSHMLDCQLFGQRAGTHHLVNAGFHLANALLLFMVLRRLTGALGRSAVVAALFALHPLHVESVAWISERKDVLSGLFFMLTLWAYARYAEESKALSLMAKTGGQEPGVRSQESKSGIQHRGPRNPNHARRYYAFTLILFALGLMSKPMLVTLPFVLLLLDYWPLRRLKFQDSSALPGRTGASALKRNAGWELNALGSLIWEKAPFLALSLVSSVVTFAAQQKGGAVSTSISLNARLANALISYARYLGKAIWPEKLSVLYPHPGHWPAWQVVAAAALLLAFSAGAIALARSRPYLAVGWFWFAGTLVPVIGIIQVGIQSMADRYTYVPLIGLLIMVVWGIGELFPERPGLAKPMAAAALSIVACALLSVRQLQHWRNSETLFRHAVQVTKNNYLAYNNLGFYLSGQGKMEEAMENYRLALTIEPNYEDAQNNLGYALAGQKKYPEAIEHYQAALRVRPNHVEVHNNLGNALADIGKLDEAIAHYLIVLKQQPDHADAHNNLGIALAMQGKLEEAIGHFHEAIRCRPSYASAHSNLGNALAAQHKMDAAIAEYQEALRLKADDAQAHNNLANALTEQGRLQEAVGHYQEALRLNADNPEAHCNLGAVLARQGKKEAAIAHFEAALQLRPDFPEARKQLAELSAGGKLN